MQELTPHEQEILDRYSSRGDYKKYTELFKDSIMPAPVKRHYKENDQLIDNLSKVYPEDSTANLLTGHMPPFDMAKGMGGAANMVNEFEAAGMNHSLAQMLSGLMAGVYQPTSWATHNLTGSPESWGEMVTDLHFNIEGIKNDPEGYQDIEQISDQWNAGRFADEVVSRSQGSSPEIDSIMNEIYSAYPAMERWGVQVIDSRDANHGPRSGGHLEFYHPDDEGAPNNPNQFFGTPTVEVFDPNLKGDWLKQAIMGDMMHYAPTASPEFNDLREQYRGTLESNPMNRYMNKRRYKYAQDNQGESRDYDKWFEASGLDAHIRGRLSPDENNEWVNAHTPEQIKIVERMKEALKKKPSLEQFLK